MNKIKNLTIEKLKNIFKKYQLYSQEYKKEPKVVLEIFIPNQNIYWLMTEGSVVENDFIMFGYCKITYGELGYVSFNDLVNMDFDIRYKIHKIPIKLRKLKNKYLKVYN